MAIHPNKERCTTIFYVAIMKPSHDPCNNSTPEADTAEISFLFPFTAASIMWVSNTMNLFSGNAPTENIHLSTCTIAKCRI